MISIIPFYSSRGSIQLLYLYCLIRLMRFTRNFVPFLHSIYFLFLCVCVFFFCWYIMDQTFLQQKIHKKLLCAMYIKDNFMTIEFVMLIPFAMKSASQGTSVVDNSQ